MSEKRSNYAAFWAIFILWFLAFPGQVVFAHSEEEAKKSQAALKAVQAFNEKVRNLKKAVEVVEVRVEDLESFDKTLVLDFSGLAWAEASGLYTFMDDHLGLEIGILDWEHRFWRGVITKQDQPIVQDGPGCKYTVGFEFEGELTTYDPGP